MSKVKNIKLQKMRAKSLWPSVIGLFFGILLFGILSSLALTIVIQNTVYSKISENYNKSKLLVGQVERSWDGESDESFQHIINIFRANNSDITTVLAVAADGNVVAQNGDYAPESFNKDELINLNLEEGIQVTIEDTVEKGFVISTDGILIDIASLIRACNSTGFFSDDFLSHEWGKVEFAETNPWYVFNNICQNDIYVRGKVVITRSDVVALVETMGLTILLGMVIIIIQIVSLIRGFAERRRIFRVWTTDRTTGGKNWYYFKHYGSRKKYYKPAVRYAVVVLRINKFKNFCLVHGENEGEDLLENVYYILNRYLAGNELLCYKGDAEFALLLRVDSKDKLNNRINAVINAIKHRYPEEKLRISVGVRMIENDRSVTDDKLVKADRKIDREVTIENLCNQASLACNSVSPDGEGRIVWFSEEMREALTWEHTVENDMEKALANHEFVMYLQPKYTTGSEVIGGAEALCRWIHPTEGFVPPYKFIPIFENNGFIMKLDDYMIEEVAKAQAGWLAEGREVVPISVNVSRAHFTMDDLAEHIAEIIDRYEVPHQYIELELTESAFFDDKNILLTTVRKLQEMGFLVSMDDFGAGYSSLNSLKELPLDVIKIDAEFFRGADTLNRADLIVSDTISLAKKLGMHIVAEGIETREQVDFLAREECDLIQGFFFAKPMPVEEFEKLSYGIDKQDEIPGNQPFVTASEPDDATEEDSVSEPDDTTEVDSESEPDDGAEEDTKDK